MSIEIGKAVYPVFALFGHLRETVAEAAAKRTGAAAYDCNRLRLWPVQVEVSGRMSRGLESVESLAWKVEMRVVLEGNGYTISGCRAKTPVAKSGHDLFVDSVT